MNVIDRLKTRLNHFWYVDYRYLRHTYTVEKGFKEVDHPSSYIIALVRERNESLILKDTLDHLAKFADGIILFDDASTDDSTKIAKDHPAVIKVITRKKWQKKHREWTETVDRNILIKYAKKYNPEWLFYADADERFEGDITGDLKKLEDSIKGVNVALFDAYITKNDKTPYQQGTELMNFRKYFGPERRDILMMWRNEPDVWFEGPIARIPKVKGKVVSRFYCQHYGKSLSIEHWEETCNYYVKHFPKYREKWRSRKGKAVHTRSDFDRKLYAWNEVKKHSIKIN